MTYEDFMTMGLLPDSTQEQMLPATRDTISEAFKLQMLLNMVFGEQRHEAQEGEEDDDAGGAVLTPNTLTAERGFAGHMAKQAMPISPSAYYTAEGYNTSAEDMLFGGAEEDGMSAEHGRPTDPGLGLFAPMNDMPPPAAFSPAGPTDHELAFSPQTMNGLADALGPDVSSVARLGGPFAGYTPDMLTRRLQELVNRVR